MENITAEMKALMLANLKTSWLHEIITLCTVVPIGVIGTALNLMSLIIFLKKSIRKLSLFKYFILISVVNSIIGFNQIFYFYFMPNLFYDLSLSKTGRFFAYIGRNYIGVFFFFLGNLLEIMTNIERAVYFSEGFLKFKKISSYLISFLILILSLVIFIPNILSSRIVPEDQLYRIFRVSLQSNFAHSQIGKILLLISYILEGPVVFLLLIATNISAIISYRRYNKRKELADRANNIEMMAEGEVKKRKKIEKKDRNLMISTAYLSLISIIAVLIVFLAQYFYFIETRLEPQTVGWLIYAGTMSIALKQFTAIATYYNYKIFRKEMNRLIKQIFSL